MPRQKRTGKHQNKGNQQVKLPHGWDPYPWQDEVLQAMKRGVKRFMLVVHRRAGKDQVALNMHAIASQMRVGQYWHVYPYQKSARDHIWLGADKESGIRFIDQAFPYSIRAPSGKKNQPMEIHLDNGSIFKLMGSDNFDALRGGEPLCVTFSEAAFAHPDSWAVVRPILRKNNGIVCFITTPNGPNWFYEFYERVKDNPDWFVRHLTVNDTKDWDGNPIFSEEDIQAERDEGASDDEIEREYYCSFRTGASGAYYVNELKQMHEEGRIRAIEYDPKRPVIAAFDLGNADLTVGVFMQKKGNAHYLIAHRAWQYTKMEDVLDEVQVMFPWKVDKYLMPHDLATGMALNVMVSALEKYGEVIVVPKTSVHSGIQQVRQLCSTLWIDNSKHDWGDNATLIEAMSSYRSRPVKQTDRRHRIASASPAHTWESHYMDALRYYAVADAQELTGSNTKWGPAPNYDAQDMAARTI